MITEEQIWDYLDGNLSATSRKEIEDALASDKQVAALFEEISVLHKALKTSTLMAPSASFTDRVMASIKTAPSQAPVGRFSFKPMLVFVLPTICVIAAFAGLLAYSNVPITYHVPVPDFKSFQIYFVVADLLLLAYFIDRLSEYRFNRKTFFS